MVVWLSVESLSCQSLRVQSLSGQSLSGQSLSGQSLSGGDANLQIEPEHRHVFLGLFLPFPNLVIVKALSVKIDE